MLVLDVTFGREARAEKGWRSRKGRRIIYKNYSGRSGPRRGGVSLKQSRVTDQSAVRRVWCTRGFRCRLVFVAVGAVPCERRTGGYIHGDGY